MSGFFSQDNETNLKSFVQEGEKVYQDYEQGVSGGSSSAQQQAQGQQAGQQSQQQQGGGYQQDVKDAEAAFQGGEKVWQGEEKNF